MSSGDPIDYSKLSIIQQGFTYVAFDGTSEGEQVSVEVEHGLGYTPIVVAFHKGGGGNIGDEGDIPTTNMRAMPYARFELSTTVKLRYSTWFIVGPDIVTFYRLQGALTQGAGDDQEIFKYYILAQEGAGR